MTPFILDRPAANDASTSGQHIMIIDALEKT